ncbi:glycosyltransferase family 2 protein [Pseudorhodoplanes sp.]|uniref:glycosyltransferase family 2 protein n=1 Tax=Pseudorhodoplanes sp. TaxID=1934341 RepID=UPI002C51FA61|nr:glycosyltransferase family 2 protein [Pseudorhodoplanes sp.]HWV51256.1 glycosyltransferase family 2 protein [Pseudorhodoplanes sp.]
MADLISVIVTTWNREDALDAVLRSLAVQTDRDFEVVVADDGSGEATAKLIANWVLKLGRPLKHVWQEHQGFRAAEIRNRAILASDGAYCIFLDGDCIARPGFVATHRKLAERGWFVTGNRILMSEALTQTVLRDNLDPERWTYREWARERGRGGINRTVPLMRLPLGPLRKIRFRAWRGARSCNLAIWRSDLDRVDGFDCAYQGWGREDSDLLVRLLHSGIRRKDGVFATGVLHLWHPAADRSWLGDNDQKLDDAMSDKRIRAQRGLSVLRNEDLQAKSA